MNYPAFSLKEREEKAVLALVAVCALLLSIKYFTGLEYPHFYAGFSINAIHPELMTNDPVVGNELSSTGSPYRLTIFYLLPRLFGEIWLDDRFIAVLYVLSVAATFLAADRLAVALGVREIWARATILLIFLRDHMILENLVNFAHHPDFNHSALAIPISLWLLYAAIGGKGLVTVLALSALLAAVSMQVAPFTVGLALIAVAVVGSARQRAVVVLLFAAGIPLFIWALFFHQRVPEADWLPLWNQLVYHWYEGMVLPFDPYWFGLAFMVFGNVAFALLLGAVVLWPVEPFPALRAVRAIAIVSLVTWLVLGLYVQFAPDGWKLPQLLIFPLTRQLQYPQILAYIALMAVVFRWADARPGVGRAATAAAVLFVMLVVGPGNFGKWSGLLLAAAVSAIVFFAAWRRQGAVASFPAFLASSYKPAVCTAFALTMTVAMAKGVSDKLPDWQFLIRTGIHGASDNARWVDVARYLRDNTPVDAVVVPMRFVEGKELRANENKGDRLLIRRNVASRSGRAIPYPMLLSHGLNLTHFKFAREQEDLLQRIAAAWMAGDGATVTAAVELLRPKPDYLVVPTAVATRVDGPGFPIAETARVGEFTVLKRTAGAGAPRR